MSRITVLGVGNPLLKDDGVGPRVIEELNKGVLPSNVDAVEAGRSFFQLWDICRQSKHVIIVDALQAGGPPGTIYLLNHREISRHTEASLFGHEDDLLGAIDLLARFDTIPEVTVIGIEPKEISFALELSPEISARIPRLVRIIRRHCLALVKSL